MKKGNLAGALFAASVVAFAVLSACTDNLRAGIDVAPEVPEFTNHDSMADASTQVGLCNAYDCPAPYATCLDKSGLCTTNLSNDVDHCGSCDVRCPSESSELRAFFTCVDARCQMRCRANAADCDGLIDNGCEAALESDPQNCGACGTACAPGELCWRGACGCPSGRTNCNGECVRTDDDPLNCGACGNSCGGAPASAVTWACGEGVIPEDATIGCAKGKCQTMCADGRADCNGDFCGDGCETGIADTPNCGACGRACKDEEVCVSGRCRSCGPGTTLCGSECVDLQSDANNCGACGNACPGLPGLNGSGTSGSGSPVCVLGRCSYECAVGYANCDGRLENGCEVDLTVDPQNCGACGKQCDLAGGQPCAGGECLTQPCDAGVVN